MNPNIQIVQDHKRGCGWRQTRGACYFRFDGPGIACGALPLELKPCPTCASLGLKCGVKPSRGFTWIDPSRLFDWNEIRCGNNPDGGLCPTCAMSRLSKMDHVGLLWVGGRHYSSPKEFDDESNRLGISRRIPHDHLPRGFVIGRDWLWLAHRDCIPVPVEDGEEPQFKPGIFRAFRPDRVEVICTGDETDAEIEAYLERGLTPVMIERVND